MKVVSGLSDAALDTPCALSIGNFDGLHLGHQSILGTVVEQSRKLGVRSAILTFDPHPVRILAPEYAPRLITTLQQKLRLIESAGIDLVFVARFDRAFASLTPDAFIQKYLVEGLRAKSLCVGSNFTFGYKQAGTIDTLRQWAHTLELIESPSVSVRGILASSTGIRQRVHDGKVSRACRLLGRWFEIEGRIVAGEGRGRKMTVPTLNLESDNELIPPRGVYITRIAIDSGEYSDSLTNIGTRPTFGSGDQTIETFVLRGAVPEAAAAARLQFLRRIRDERKFDSPELLRRQIGHDIRIANRFFRMLESEAGTMLTTGNLPHAEIHSH